jgi:RNA polymerase sigma-70 factor (ECF subfamily)
MREQVKKNEPRPRNEVVPLSESEDEHIGLMFRAAKGDQSAYVRIYEIYRPAVSDYLVSLNGQCSWHDREDMTQEVFARAWKKADEFRGRSSVKTYLYGFTRYVWREHLNRHTTEDSQQQKLAQENGKMRTAPSPEKALCDREAIHILKKAIKKLSKKQQQVIDVILEDRDISMTKAAQDAGLSESAYRKMFSIAKKHLRDVCDVEDLT